MKWTILLFLRILKPVNIIDNNILLMKINSICILCFSKTQIKFQQYFDLQGNILNIIERVYSQEKQQYAEI
jgi:hypothetical protein